METKVNPPIYDERRLTKPPIVTYLESFINPVMGAENKKNPRKEEQPINMEN